MGPFDPFAESPKAPAHELDEPRARPQRSMLAPSVGAGIGVASAILILTLGALQAILVVVLGIVGAAGGLLVVKAGPRLRRALEALLGPDEEP